LKWEVVYLTAEKLIIELQSMIEKKEITPRAVVMLQGVGQNASTMGGLRLVSPRIPLVSGPSKSVILSAN